MEYKEVTYQKGTKIIDIIAKEYSMSKNEVKRLIKQRGIKKYEKS